MGAWSEHSFGNDAACDWAADLEGADDLAPVEQALNAVLARSRDYLEVDEGCAGIAACEVVARLNGKWGLRDAYSESVDAWVQQHPGTPPQTLVAKALAALDRIAAPDSELRELWEESDDFVAWQAAVTDLRGRVAG